MSIGDMKISDIKETDVIKGFLFMAKEGLCKREEILEKIDLVLCKIEDLNARIEELNNVLAQMDSESVSRELFDDYGTQEQVEEKLEAREKELELWNDYQEQLEALLSEHKNFNKTLCFSNIRELLKQNPDVKIGQIEKEAGIRLGYMSRLDKEGNTSEPSMEFIVTAARLLKVSIDTLISVNLVGLTPTEQYLVNFFDKLKADTLADKLDWRIESTDELNRMDTDMNGNVAHPLFDLETFYEEGETDYPDQVTRVVFTSKSFGPTTYITGDCYNLKMKNGTVLYLMDIEKSVHKTGDPNAFAKEIWTFTPFVGSQCLVCDKDDTPIAPLIHSLFAVVKERMQHPRIGKDVMNAIESFMMDDLGDDDDDNPPFV